MRAYEGGGGGGQGRFHRQGEINKDTMILLICVIGKTAVN